MKRPTLTEAAIGLTLAVAIAVPLGIAFAPQPARPAVIHNCPDASVGGYPNDPVTVCQVGSVRNP